MNKVRIANIVKKLTELSQEDRKELTNILLKGLENGVPASEFNEVKEDVNALKGKNYVLYDNQELTEDEQMQARKNQDLYYEEEVEEVKTASWNDITPSGTFYTKLSDDTPALADIVAMLVNGESVEYDIVDEQDWGYVLQDYRNAMYLFSVVRDASLTNGQFAANGIYSDERTQDIAALSYKVKTTAVHQIPDKYLPVQESDIFIVKFSTIYQDEPPYSRIIADKTYKEISNAAKDGKIIFGLSRYYDQEYESGIVYLYSRASAGTHIFYGIYENNEFPPQEHISEVCIESSNNCYEREITLPLQIYLELSGTTYFGSPYISRTVNNNQILTYNLGVAGGFFEYGITWSVQKIGNGNTNFSIVDEQYTPSGKALQLDVSGVAAEETVQAVIHFQWNRTGGLYKHIYMIVTFNIVPSS